MDGQPCRHFFLEPKLTFHRRYEALRAFFVEDRPVPEIAAQFGYKPTALKVMISRFHTQFRQGSVPPFLSPTVEEDQPDSCDVKTWPAPKNPQFRISGS
jgi:hypothetical protein